MAFDFGDGAQLALVRVQLEAALGRLYRIPTRAPIGQLVKSLISSRTRDDVSLGAYARLVGHYSTWSDLAAATVDEVQDLIADVTFPDVKARRLRETLHAIAAVHPDFDLSFLGRPTIAEALAWLEAFPGVGRKVSASTLNFSTLERPAFVVDTHVLRVLRRFGFVRAKAETRNAYEAVMAATAGWTAVDLAELHLLLKRLGQTVCRAEQPLCRGCPIGQRCRSANRSHDRIQSNLGYAESGRH